MRKSAAGGGTFRASKLASHVVSHLYVRCSSKPEKLGRSNTCNDSTIELSFQLVRVRDDMSIATFPRLAHPKGRLIHHLGHLNALQPLEGLLVRVSRLPHSDDHNFPRTVVSFTHQQQRNRAAVNGAV